jgi:hypothetical protein
MSSGNSTANAATRFSLRVRPFGGVFGYKAVYTVPGNGIYECEAAFPLPLPEKSDVDIAATATAGASYVTTQLQIVLIKNEYDPGNE